ncbi:hypothetical protein EDB83DRAFT_248925 [Lactarius deliciosus]|nr:hypothetical protein EDB83DRAFT_248925 [Lactarius deliciosus]
MALCDPTIFFDQLFELNAVLTAQMYPLFVLSTFLSGRLDALHAWQTAHTDTSRSVHDDRDLNRAARSSTVCFPSVSLPPKLCFLCFFQEIGPDDFINERLSAPASLIAVPAQVSRAYPVGSSEHCWSRSSRGPREVSHLGLDVVAFPRRCSEAVTMAVGPAPKLSGGTADAHQSQTPTRVCRFQC